MSKESHQLFPLTQAQQRIWYTEVLYPNTNACILSGSLVMRGQIKIDALIRSIQLLIECNDAFRIRLTTEHDEPKQYVEPYQHKEINFLDFTGDHKEIQVEEWLHVHNHKPMELLHSELYEFVLLKVKEEEIWCSLKMHHIVSDGISMNLIGNQMMQNYLELLKGTSLSGEAKHSYIDYIQAEAEYEQSERFNKDRAYWLGKFDTLPETTGIKAYNPLSLSTTAKRDSVIINNELYKRLKSFSQEHQVGVFTLFLSALYIYLHKVTNQHDVTIGTIYANRTMKKEKDTIGMFASTVAARVCVDLDADLLSFLRTVAKEQSAILRHQKYPYNQLVQDLRDIHKNVDVGRLFGVAMEYQPMSWLHFDDISIQIHNQFCGHEINDFVIHVKEMMDDQYVELIIDYRTELWEDREIKRMLGQLLTITEYIICHPHEMLRQVSLISEEEKNTLLHVTNDTKTDYPRDKTIQQLFEEQAERSPEQVAVVFEEQHLTYRELNEQANKLARTLRAAGVQPDQTVGLITERSLEMMIGIFGILKAGGAYVPIDPEYPEERIRYMLEDSGAQLLLVQGDLRGALPFYNYKVIDLHDTQAYHDDGSNLEPVAGPNDLAYVMYTSGTTGKPKGNVTTHRNIVRIARNTNYIDITVKDRILQLSSYAFDGSTFDFYGTLLNGATLVLVSKDSLLDMEKLTNLIASERISVMFVTTALFNVLLDMRIECFREIRKILFGGERASVDHVRKALQYMGPGKLIHVYGPTESTVFATYYEIDEINPNAVHVSIGKPLSNTTIYIVNQQEELQPFGAAGELCIGGEGLARGYLNRPELTAEKFVDNPFAPGERMYRTGDLARWMPDGNIEYLGRIDDQVKIRGYRIELTEVEAHLSKLSSVQTAVVTVWEDEGGQKQLTAYFVANRPLSAGELKAEMAKELPGYMIPTYFVQLSQMPLTSNGKVNRKALPAPEESMRSGPEYVKPRTHLELKLAEIWQEVLGVQDIGVRDNFFDRGGHSLRAAALTAKIHKEMHKKIPVRDVFLAPTIEEMAQMIAGMEQQVHASIPTVGERAYYPVSSAQKRLYILNHLKGAELSYNMPGAMAVEGPLDCGRLEQAFYKLIERHEALRTGFEMINGEPVQRVYSDVEFSVEYLKAEEGETEALIRRFIRPFDLQKPPLLRVGLIEIEPNRHILLFDMHHIISDGASIRIVIEEFVRIYGGEKLQPLPVQYKDYAAWQESEMQGERMMTQESHWLNIFAGELPVLNMPTDFARPAVQSYEGDIVEFVVGKESMQALQQIAAQSGSTLYMVLLAAYTTLLHKYTGQEDIIVGTPIAGRGHADLENVIGMFVGTLALRTYPAGEKPFLDYVQEVKEQALKAYENQEYPFESLVEKLQPRRDLSRNPLFDTMFVLQNGEQGKLDIEGLQFTSLPDVHRTAKFDLNFQIIDESEKLVCRIEYATSLYTSETVERMAKHFLKLVDAIANEPGAPLTALEMITATEKTAILEEYNDTAAAYPHDKTIHGLFEEQVERTPDQTAVVYGNNSMTYRELNERANQLARTLQSAGVQTDQPVAIMAERSLEMMVGIYAILKAGGAYVPIDPDYPQERIRYILDDSGAKLLLTQRHVKEQVAFAGRVIDLDDASAYHEDGSNLEILVSTDDMAYVIYTSGSTGKPKGVMVEHRPVINRLLWMQQAYPIASGDTILQKTAITFDVSVWELFWWAFVGAKMCLLPPGGEKNPEVIYNTIEEQGITTMHFVPSMLHAFLEFVEGQPTSEQASKLRTLRQVFASGEALAPTHVSRFHRLVTPVNGAWLINLYGPTEATVDVSYFNCEADQAYKSVPIGKPISNIQLYVVASGSMQLQPVGVPGELCIAGDGLARGYLNRPELTAEKFVDHPLESGKRMYRTGDLARWLPDGNIEYLGRIDHQVKIRGYRIELGEVEAQLLKIASVQEAIVLSREDQNGQKELCAYFTADRTFTVSELRGMLSMELPGYMIPSYFVQLDQMPLTPNGKVDRKALPAPEGTLQTGTEYVAPRTLAEAQLARIWEEVIGVSRIGVKDNFFDIGGHSLRATTMAAKIHQEMGWNVTLREIFQFPTIEGLAAVISGMGQTNHSEITVVEERDFYPLSSAQNRLYILSQIEGADLSYNMPAVFTVEGQLDRLRLEEAFRTLIERHETLRTGFDLANGEPVQRIYSDAVFAMEFLEASEEEADEFIRNFVRAFDLRKPPLLRVGLVELGHNRHLLCIDMHHIISDGASIGILVQEFVSLYKGEELAPLRIQYKDYAVWQQAQMQSERMSAQEAYWLGAFQGELPVLHMPTDFARPTVQDYKGHTFQFVIDRQRMDGLRQIATDSKATLYMVLLAAYTSLLHKYTGQEDIVIGTPVAGRAHADTGNLLGMFVGTLALRHYPAGEKTFLSYLEEVKETALGAYENQEYPFENLVEKLGIQRDLSRHALFDTMFILQNAERGELLIEGLQFSPRPYEHTAAKFDLTLSAVEETEGIQCSLEYAASLYKPETVQRMSQHFIRLIDTMIHDPHMQLSSIDIATPEEKAHMAGVLNNTDADYPLEQTISGLFEKQAELQPNEEAVICGNNRLTYRELNERANRLARTLRTEGVQPDQRVCILAERSLEMVISILAILKAGGAYVPIDPEFPSERIRYILEDSGAELLLLQRHLPEGVSFGGKIIDLRDEEFYSQDSSNLAPAVGPHHLAYVLYTSGSTGTPKGVMIEHQSVINILTQIENEYPVMPGDSYLLKTTYTFDVSVTELFGWFFGRGKLVILQHGLERDPAAMAEVIEEHKVTHINFVPSMLGAMLNYANESNSTKFESLKYIFACGEALPATMVEQWCSLPWKVRLENIYGPTEATIYATKYSIPTSADMNDSANVPIGKPLGNYRVWIVNSNNHLQPIGVPGELCIAGVGVARGYLNRPELNAEQFITNPFVPGERMYRTGDLARWLPDGNIEYLGRVDHQVKIRGYRIELGEVEAQFLKTAPVREAVVIAREDETGQKQLCAYFTADQQLTPGELRSALSGGLPGYMIPSYFMQLERMPLTQNGKLDRKALPAPEGGMLSQAEYTAPRTPLEERLAHIWQEVLGLPKVGVRDNFFDIGGHSLRAVALAAQIHKELNMSIALRQVFQYATIEQMAKEIANMQEYAFETIPVTDEREFYPLSSAQKRLFILHQIEGTELSYNMPSILSVTGTLDQRRLEEVFKKLIARHETLRTGFELMDGEPAQRIHTEVEFAVEYMQAREDETDEIIHKFVRSFDLHKPPLLRVGVIELGRERHILCFDMHHIISDGTSMGILIEEFVRMYAGEELTPLQIQYKDYAAWQQREMQSDWMNDQESYWLKQFQGEIPVLDLPTDYARPAVQSYEGGAFEFQIDPSVADQLRQFAAHTGSTLYMVLLAAYTALLHKYTKKEDIIVGTPVAGRTHAELGSLIGMFVNTLAIRSYPHGEKTLHDHVLEVKEQALKAFEHQNYPFEELVEKLNVARDLSRSPLFDTMFVLQNSEQGELDIEGLQFELYPERQSAAKFDLTFHAAEKEGGIACRIEYATALYKPETAARLAGHFIQLIEAMVNAPQTTLSSMEIITVAEKTQILDTFNDTAMEYERDKTVHQLFEEQVERTPDHLAVVYEGKHLTYRELNERANRLARTLRDKGVEADQLVGIMAERSLELIVGIFAILKAGGAYVPIDPEYPQERIRYMLEDSGTKLLLSQSHLQDRASHFNGIILDLNDEEMYREDGSNIGPVNGSDHLAYVIYTSGSTGQPKGVMVEHHGLCSLKLFFERTLEISESDRVIQFASISFDAASAEIQMALFCGATLYLPTASDILNMELFERFVNENGITMATLPPAYAHYLEPDRLSLRKLITAGSASSPELVLKWKDKVNYFNGYGPTEDSICSTVWPVSKDPDATKRVLIGRPIANHRIYIVGSDDQLLPVGIPGELCIAGVGVARGYLNRTELTAEKFVTSRFAAGERMYRTGDLARWMPDGNIEYLGRIDDQVKIRGYRIELGEVEAQLSKIASLQEAVVIARDDETGQKQLCAYFTADRQMVASELRDALSAKLPGYMIPSWFVQLENMPLTPNGKIDRKALPAPETGRTSGVDYVPPRTPPEQVLASVWQTVLGVKRIGIMDHFFDLGGDSIKAIQVSSRLHQAGWKLEMKHLFKYPTIAELSSYIQPAERSVDQGEVRGEVHLTPILRWFLGNTSLDKHHFNQAVMLYREQGFDEMALRAAMQKIAEHHDALRLVFRQTENGYTAWNREIGEGDAYSLDVFDFSEETDYTAKVTRKANEIQRSMNLQEGPLLKLGLFHCADGDHLLIAIHHLVVDGVSWRILFEDLAAAYEQALSGQSIRLPDKTESYRVWAERLVEYAGSPEMDTERAYWEGVAKIAGNKLPRDYEQSHPIMSDTEYITVQWSPEETELLLRGAHRAYNTEMNDLLLTALGLAIHRWTGMEQVPVSLEGHGREMITADLDITRTVGWFTSQYPVVLPIGAKKDLSFQIKRVKEHLRHIPNKGIGYGILKYMSEQPQAVFDDEPEILFNYLGQFDQDLQNNALQLSSLSSGPAISENSSRSYVLDVNGMVAGGVLSLTLGYSTGQYQKETMEQVGELLRTSLQEVIDHCIARERTELTPSDVLFSGLTIDELDTLAKQTAHIGEIENVFALTPMQKGMLFHSMMDPNSGAYYEQTMFTMQGHFDVTVFEQSLNALVQRHEVLRTNYYSGWQNEPIQVVFRHERPVFYYKDLRSITGELREAYIADFIREDKEKGFDLAQDALMRVTVLQTGDELYRFLWSFHHIVMDGWCLSLVAKEVFETYFAKMELREPKLEQIFAYSQYIEWLERQDKEAASTYWNDYLDGYEHGNVLPQSSAQAKDMGYTAEKLVCSFGEKLTLDIHRTAKQHQVTVNTLMQAAWGVLLQKYNGTGDVVFGSVVSGRPAELPGIEHMIGLFINTIPVRIRCDAEESFASVMRNVQEQSLAATSYDTFPLYEIQALSVHKQSLVDHILVFENYPVDQQMEQLGSGGLTSLEITDVMMAEQTNYDFNLIIVPGDEITVRMEYNACVYDKSVMERIQRHLVRIMEQIVENPQISVGEMKLLTPEERTQIQSVFNATTANYPREATIYGLFEEQAERTPDQIAVVCEGSTMTYRELNERANRLARTLRAQGVQADQLVGIMTERSLDMIVGILGILKAGGAYVPIDPEYPQERIRYMLEDSGVQLLILQGHLEEQAAFIGTLVKLDEEAAYHEDGTNLEPISGSSHLAYVIYTSGTTGKAKGTLIEHKNVVRLLFNDKNLFDFDDSDTWTMFHSYCFDFSVWEMYGALLYGGKLVVVPPLTAKNPEAFRELLREQQVTILNQTPTYFNQLQPVELACNQRELNLRKIIFGGEALSPYQLKDWKAKYPNTQLINMYGITETTVHVTYKEITEVEIQQAKSNIGKCIPTLSVYILDERQNLLPVGITGEMYVAGDGLARGYLNRPELTAEKFVDNPFVPGERMYRTGDLARWLPDGNIEYLGRIDHQVKIRGYRIELGEVEAQLLQLASIQEALVIAREDEAGQKQLCAYFTADQSYAVSELRNNLSGVLPGYMIPSYFVQLEQMPLTSNGKVDRKALPAPEGTLQNEADYMPPRNLLELQLTRIWQEVLNIQRIGVRDNFFDIGGHSLRATTMVTKIHKDLGIRVPLKEVFQSPTIGELAEAIKTIEHTAYESIPVIEEREYYPVSSSQKQLYILSHLEGGELSYNMPNIMSVEGPLDLARLETALQRLIARHEALRTGFEMVDGEPVQRVHREVKFDVEYYQIEEDLAEECMADFVRAFDLQKPPLLHVGILEHSPTRYTLLFDMHHLVTDGVSMGILIQEFVRLYGGEELPPLCIQYKDYAVWQQQRSGSERYKQLENYWLTALSGDLPVLDLVTDYPRPARLSFEGAQIDFVVNSDITEALKRLAEESGSTLFMVLLAAYTVLLAQYSGQQDIIVGTPIAGRLSADLDGVIGMFVGTLPLRNFPADNKTFLNYLLEVKENALQAFEHQEYPFERMVEQLGAARDISRNPLFDTMFTLQNTEQREHEIESLTFTRKIRESGTSKFDLSFTTMEQDNELACSIVYRTKLFKQTTIEKLSRDYLAILTAVAINPSIPLEEIETEESLGAAHPLFDVKEFAF